jgi:hypothetical protein
MPSSSPRNPEALRRSLAIRRRVWRRRQPTSDPHLFGAALTVGIALDHADGRASRLPALHAGKNARRTPVAGGLGVILGGPGWVLPGILKMLGGALLAWLALRNARCRSKRPSIPNQMYLIGFSHVFDNTTAGHRRHGAVRRRVAAEDQRHQRLRRLARVVELLLRGSRTATRGASCGWCSISLIALLLMELDVFQALGQVLGLYSNIAISWMAAVVADLVINKPLGLSPARHRVQARPPLRHQPGGRRRDGHWPRCSSWRALSAPSASNAAAVTPLCRPASPRLRAVAAASPGAPAAATTWRASRADVSVAHSRWSAA